MRQRMIGIWRAQAGASLTPEPHRLQAARRVAALRFDVVHTGIGDALYAVDRSIETTRSAIKCKLASAAQLVLVRLHA
jgi:hypothetical protein